MSELHPTRCGTEMLKTTSRANGLDLIEKHLKISTFICSLSYVGFKTEHRTLVYLTVALGVGSDTEDSLMGCPLSSRLALEYPSFQIANCGRYLSYAFTSTSQLFTSLQEISATVLKTCPAALSRAS